MRIGKVPRGEDFARKFARGEWAETVLLEAIERQEGFIAFQYGVSRGDALETAAELDAVTEPGVEHTKRPDLLVFTREALDDLDEAALHSLDGYVTADADNRVDRLPELERQGVPSAATVAIEAESSRFNVGERAFERSLSAYVKDEDFHRLRSWRQEWEVPILVCQLFFDRGYVVPFAAYEAFAEEAGDGGTPAPGFDHGPVPGIGKTGFQARVEGFPFADRLGTVTEEPQVVRRTGGGLKPCDYEWSRSGQLVAPEDAFFAGGVLSLDRPLTDYL